MKILHTADWHIGKKLHNYDLTADFDLFIQWLKNYLTEEKINILLVSGDIFDLANPSSSARSQYYKSLVELRSYVDKIILTGGNHDSPAMLDAPKELFSALDLKVVGGLPQKIEETLVPIKNKQGETTLVVAAIPFLRNPDLHTDTVVRTYEERLEALKTGIADVFSRAEESCRNRYPGIPAVAMGHLFASGVETSDSERDIQIGNQAAVQADLFGTYFKYVALGHIHKPQQVSGMIPVFYSGSPLPLSFSERKDQKRVLVIDTELGWIPKSVSVPSFRKLMKITGSLEEIQNKLTGLPQNETLPNLIEIELQAQHYQSKLLYELETLVAEFGKPGYQIVKHRAVFAQQQRQTGDLFDENLYLEELTPQKVFQELLAEEAYTDQEKKEINAAFAELLEEIQNTRF